MRKQLLKNLYLPVEITEEKIQIIESEDIVTEAEKDIVAETAVPQTVSPLAETIEGNEVTDKPQEEVMTIADAAILAARKACEEKTSLETIASEEATPSEKTVITPVTSDFEKEQKIEETTETQEISEEKKNRVSQGVILAIILIACIAGGIYWYLQSDKTSDLQSPATIKNTQEQLEEDIPAIPVNDSLMQGKDTANIWTNVAGKETISQSQQTVSPSTEKSSGVATTANVAKETLADTVEYDITGTKTNYTLQEGESLVKLAVKFYGTKKLWPYIVKHNKNIIKDADRVPIGTTLRIPELTPKK